MKKLLKLLSLALIAVIASCSLLACAPSDLSKAKEKMAAAGYNVIVTEAKEGNEDNRVGTIVVTKIEIGATFEAESFTATLFKSAKDAKAYYEKNYGSDDKEDESTVKLSGKWIYWGSGETEKVFLG